jgi:hypothetical protein
LTLPVFTTVVWLAALQADIGQRRLSNKGMERAAQGGPLRPHQPQWRGRHQQGNARPGLLFFYLLVSGRHHKPWSSPRFRELYVQ